MNSHHGPLGDDRSFSLQKRKLRHGVLQADEARRRRRSVAETGTARSQTHQSTVSHLSLGFQTPQAISQDSKALFNKQARCKPNHNSFIGISMLSLENPSAGCRRSVKGSQSLTGLQARPQPETPLSSVEGVGYTYFVLSHGASVEE
uniref:Uncharacterized protein n=1 Tax=Canis lupus dingo TaxID=286419 RepID=A0A8C0LHF6_CANLU